jgi:hypothetical protein
MINSTSAPDVSCRACLERIDSKAYRGDAGRLTHAGTAGHDALNTRAYRV